MRYYITIPEDQSDFDIQEEIKKLNPVEPYKFYYNPDLGKVIVEDSKPEPPTPESAIELRKQLVEFNYNGKCNKAYTGVIFDYDREELIFQTDTDSFGLINFMIIRMSSDGFTLPRWKCWTHREPSAPKLVKFTNGQFLKLINFAQLMINEAFELEQQINDEIKNLTDEQISSELFVEEFKRTITERYHKINTKLLEL